MSWTDALKPSVTAAVAERPEQYTPLFNAARPIGWDPHDVWLTRVRQPRKLAASAAVESASNFLRR